MFQRDSDSRFCIASIICLLATSASAQPSDNMIALMESGVEQYADISGTVASCEYESGRSEIDALIDDVAAWRYSSWWDGLSGKREDYAAKLKASAHLTYDLKALDDCPGPLFIGGYRSLKQHWHDQIIREVKKD